MKADAQQEAPLRGAATVQEGTETGMKKDARKREIMKLDAPSLHLTNSRTEPNAPATITSTPTFQRSLMKCVNILATDCFPIHYKDCPMSLRVK